MDDSDKLVELFQKVGLPDAIRVRILALGLSTPSMICWTWDQVEDREGSIANILNAAGTDAGDAVRISQTVEANFICLTSFFSLSKEYMFFYNPHLIHAP